MISASARRLNVFKSVVDCGGFNLAAMRLGIAQPSVGAHIKALEAQLGQPLFVRVRGTKPRLTQAGEAVYAYAVDVLLRSEEATKTLSELPTTPHEITIAVCRDIAPHFLPSRVAAFARQFPKVRVITRSRTIDEVIYLVRSDTVTVGIFLSAGTVTGMRSQVLAHESLVLVVGSHHPLAKHRSVTSDQLAAFPFVTGLRGSRFFKMTDSAVKAIGLNDYRIGMEVEESNATKEILRHGQAIACLAQCTVAAEIATGALAALSPQTPLRQLELRYGYSGQLTEVTRNFLLCLERGAAVI
jgi:LysR family transcriptional regulator, low CO2-responsive transcriptional regulator